MSTTKQEQDSSVEAETTVEETELVTIKDVTKLFNEKGSERLRMQMQSGIVNPIELARVLNVRPQMIYNYVRKGAIKDATSHNSTGKLVISLDAATAWARKYLDGRARRQAKIESELRGEVAA